MVTSGEDVVIRQFLVSQMMVFAYLVGSGSAGDAIVIDPADDADLIIREARSLGMEIRAIVNTHAHVDHVMGNAEMKARTGAPIILHEEDAELLVHQPPEMFRMFGGRPSPPADKTLRDGDTISVGDLSLEVIHTPGHTPGGICLYMPGAVFTGDTLFVGGVGRTDLPGGSWAVLERSIRERLFTLPDETVVYPGHHYGPRPTTTIGTEKNTNPFL
jgi:glyoxylase-like metal-dependent hydrolase (beta-lactamase superfamily II)